MTGSAADLSLSTARDASAPTSAVSLTIKGMDCPSCAGKIETAVGRLPGLRDIRVAFTTERLTFTRTADSATVETVMEKVRDLGFVPGPATTDREPSADHEERDHRDPASEAPANAPLDHKQLQDHDHAHAHSHDADVSISWWRTPKGKLVIVSGALCTAAFLVSLVAPATSIWVYVAATLVGVVPVARRAWALARSGIPLSIETLMTIATVGALAIGAASEAAVVVFLFAVGELLEGVAAGRARAGIKGLVDLMPKSALLELGNQTIEVPASNLKVGQIIRARPGDRIAADGRILEGASDVDDSPVTGESAPKRKEAGDRVFAGSINQDAVLRIEVDRAARDNTIARIIRLVEVAQEAKAPTARFIDRFSTYYTPAIVVIAGLVVLVPVLGYGQDWSTWIYRGLALLLIACPCALVISTPAAIASALAAGARRGLLMKGGAVLEALAKVRVVALDKTGTLTEGRPHVTNIIPYGRTEQELLQLAAAVEGGTSHPIGRAIVVLAQSQKLTVPAASGVHAMPGKGIAGEVQGRMISLVSPRHAATLAVLSSEASETVAGLEQFGKTVIVVFDGNAVAGLVAMRDEPRPDALQGINTLRGMGLRPVMLTGDSDRPAKAIAGDLMIEVMSGLLPEDKARIVSELAKHGPVAKVGDGINDAPALAAASVGIAMGSGTDVALETADAALLNNRVIDVAGFIALARRSMAVIHQNIAIALGLKLVFLVTTVVGATGLWIAILADTGATVLVTLNALRLLRHGADSPSN